MSCRGGISLLVQRGHILKNILGLFVLLFVTNEFLGEEVKLSFILNEIQAIMSIFKNKKQLPNYMLDTHRST